MMELVSSPITEKEVSIATRRDPILSLILNNVLSGWREPDKNLLKEFKSFQTIKEELTAEGGCVLWGNRVVIPRTLRGKVLTVLHEVHPGMNRMKSLARSFVWWPGMDMDIEERVRHCSICQKHQNNPSAAPLHVWEYPSAAWERLHIDFAGPFMGNMFLIVIDAYSKWIEVEVMNKSTPGTTISKLRKIFATHGLPQLVVSDNGPSFIAEEFKFILRSSILAPLMSSLENGTATPPRVNMGVPRSSDNEYTPSMPMLLLRR